MCAVLEHEEELYPLPIYEPPALYAFVGYGSAVQCVRRISGTPLWKEAPRWPAQARMLPVFGDCVCNQRAFKKLASEVELERYGIDSRPVDLLVPDRRMRSQGKGAKFHPWTHVTFPHAFVRVHENLLVSRPELVIVQLCGAHAKLDGLFDGFIASLRAEEEARAAFGVEGDKPTVENPVKWENRRRLVEAAVLACEFAGRYRLPGTSGGVDFDASPVLTLASLAEVLEALGSRGYSQAVHRAQKVRELAFDGSASPMETSLALLLTLPLEFGGFGLPRPQLNVPIDVSASCGQMTVTPDFLWREQRVALEYDSDEFHVNKGREQAGRDALRANALLAGGYRVFRATTQMTRTLEGVAVLAGQLAAALGADLAEPTEVEELRRRRLFAELMPKVQPTG